MIIEPHVPLHRLILSLSAAIDGGHPQIVDHQQRVAHIAISVARRLGFRGTDLLDVFVAAALHDIGLIGVENKLKGIHLGRMESVEWHAEAGYQLLKDKPLFAKAAEIIRYHHVHWADGAGAEDGGQPVSMASHIIALADTVERAIDRSLPVLEQTEFITEKLICRLGKEFHPDCVKAFCSLSEAEAFWLDSVSDRIYAVLLKNMDWPAVNIDEFAIGPIAEMFGQIVDGASPWTMVHTAGVAATANALAVRFSFSPREVRLMQAAGYFHDLGKLSVPSRILDKPNRLTKDEMSVVKGHAYHTFCILETIGGMPQINEWAAFHHERLDGKGYPFHHTQEELTLGSRIMSVADILTALMEDRPYRGGMSSEKAIRVLDDLASNGGHDGDVIETLKRDFDAIDGIRREAQAAYGEKQKELFASMKSVRRTCACMRC